MPKLIPALLLAVSLLGCQSQSSSRGLDPDRLLHMAGEEAGQITTPAERLARQLNIADREAGARQLAAARATLRQARATLEGADPQALTEHQRLAGWVSLSELSRAAEDPAFANAALDRALAILNELSPMASRPDYVLGVDREVRALRGDPAAARLLVTAADWAMEIPAEPTRRAVLLAFAEGAAFCSDYDGARAILRHDKDAAWRSDSLTAMADHARNVRGDLDSAFTLAPLSSMAVARSESPGSDARPATQPTPIGSFGKALDFRSNYYRPR